MYLIGDGVDFGVLMVEMKYDVEEVERLVFDGQVEFWVYFGVDVVVFDVLGDVDDGQLVWFFGYVGFFDD